jgi:hypothetical protein
VSEIRIGPKTQVIGVLALIGTVAAGIATQLPELRRYLKVRSMD